jgi:hypothetical protein
MFIEPEFIFQLRKYANSPFYFAGNYGGEGESLVFEARRLLHGFVSHNFTLKPWSSCNL